MDSRKSCNQSPLWKSFMTSVRISLPLSINIILSVISFLTRRLLIESSSKLSSKLKSSRIVKIITYLWQLYFSNTSTLLIQKRRKLQLWWETMKLSGKDDLLQEIWYNTPHRTFFTYLRSISVCRASLVILRLIINFSNMVNNTTRKLLFSTK
jgi:hypothetical protein